MIRGYCNSVSPGKTHACELESGHEGKCRQERFEGGYALWDGRPGIPAAALAAALGVNRHRIHAMTKQGDMK